jgi:hypothetical protein
MIRRWSMRYSRMRAKAAMIGRFEWRIGNG